MKHLNNTTPQATRRWPSYSMEEAIDLYHRHRNTRYNAQPDRLERIKRSEILKKAARIEE